jgi:Ligand-binding domain of nuclear hormone receptor
MGARAMFANVKHGLVLSTGMCISPAHAELFGLSGLVERMSAELIAKMTELQVDSFELACLRGIILFNPGRAGIFSNLREFFLFLRNFGKKNSNFFFFTDFVVLDAKGLTNADRVEACREKLYSGLEEHCHQMHPQDVSRFAKLLLRLPSLRSISLKCTGVLFFSQLFPTLQADGFLHRLMQQPNRDLRSIRPEVEAEEFQRKLLGTGVPDSSASGGLATLMSVPMNDYMQSGMFGGNGMWNTNGSQQPRPPSADGMYNFANGLIKQEPSNSFQ